MSLVWEVMDLGSTGLNGRTLGLILAAYGVLTLVFTYPIALNILTQPAGSTDVYEYMWELWWAKRSLIDLHISPANVTVLYHPYGTHHPILWLDTYLMWTSLPLVMLFGPTVACNVQILSSYLLTGFSTYLLCYWLTKNHWASFVGGLIFAFSPFRSDRAAHGVISMALTYWLPLYVLFLLKLFKRPNVRNALFCGICLAFSILSSFLHLVHFIIPATAIFLVYQHFADRRSLYNKRFVKGFGLALALAFIVIIPIYVPLLTAKIGRQLDYFARFGVLGHSAALLSFLVPPSFQLIVRVFEPLRTLVQELLPGRYYVVYLGVLSLVLAAWGVFNRKARLWVLMALVSGVLALGPLLHITRELVEYSVAGRTGFVLLPGAILTQLPLYEWARSPARFGELTVFSIAVLASFGALALSRIAGRRMVRSGVMCILPLLILLDFALFFPFPTQDVRVPEFYEGLPRGGEEYGVLDVGSERFNHQGMYFQTVHQLPIARGFIYRYPSGTQYYQKFFEQLTQAQPDIVNADRFASILRQLDIKYVVLHKLSEVTVEEVGPFLTENLGSPVYEDEQIMAFVVPASDGGEIEEPPLLMLGEQWHPTESVGGVPSRWMVNDGTIYARADTTGPYQLSLVAHPFQGPRHLQIFVDEELVEEYHVGGMQSYVTSPFVLKSGEWTPIRFHVLEGCQVPSEVVAGETDDRCLSMLFQQIDIVPIESEILS